MVSNVDEGTSTATVGMPDWRDVLTFFEVSKAKRCVVKFCSMPEGERDETYHGRSGCSSLVSSVS